MRQEWIRPLSPIRVESISTVEVTRTRGYRHSYRNGRIKYGIVYLVKGCLRERFFSGEEILLQQGELLFIPKKSRYVGIYEEDGTHARIIQFDLAECPFPDYLSRPVKITVPEARELAESFFLPSKKNESSLFLMAALYRLLGCMERSFSSLPTKFQRLRPALERMEEHFQEKDTVAQWALLCEMSEVHFRRVFRDYTGQGPVEYRNRLRLERARELLQSGEYNVSEAAFACGFSNLSFFIRLYKKRFGNTPKQE